MAGKYGEPWVARHDDGAGWSVRNANGPVASMAWFQFNTERMNDAISEATARRIVACVNLLADVPDDAPCFRTGVRSNEDAARIGLALAVLRGDHAAAAMLADEVVAHAVGVESPARAELKAFAEALSDSWHTDDCGLGHGPCWCHMNRDAGHTYACTCLRDLHEAVTERLKGGEG